MGLYKLWALEALKKTDDVNRGMSTSTNGAYCSNKRMIMTPHLPLIVIHELYPGVPIILQLPLLEKVHNLSLLVSLHKY